jgi:hypothetical protein
VSSAGPAELNAASVIAQLEAGAYPREVILTLARGFLPLPQEDLIPVFAWLMGSQDTEVATLAQASFADVPARAVHAFAANEQANPHHLSLLTNVTNDAAALELLIRNRALPDEVVAELARHAEPAVQEIIVINQARILRAPHILDALLENPRLGGEARRRALETREEFFEKKARIQALRDELGEDVVVDIPEDEIADLLEQAVQEDKVELPPIEPPDDERGRSAWSKILKMSVSEKVKLAYKGDKTMRSILVRERNRLIASAVMRNPRMTPTEVESIAGMRNVEEEVLRLIALRREWSTKYPVVLALAKNPKAPLGVVLPLINRLTLRDLKSLKDDKGVAEAVRVNARKFYIAKQK